MASKSITTIALLLTLNLLFFTMVTSTSCPPPPKKHVHPVKPSPTPMPVKPKSCPIDTLKLGACGNVLNGLLNIVIGTPSKTACCSLIRNLADLDAAVCLCTALKANILGLNLNVPISLSLLLNYCDKKETSGYKCK